MNPETKERAAMLRQVADIIETNHPWQWWHISDQTWRNPDDFHGDLIALIGSGEHKIRPVLATPPDGLTLHNPLNLTAEQVGIGYRLLCTVEVRQGEYWSQKESRWKSGVLPCQHLSPRDVYRVPISTPWPETSETLEKEPVRVPLEPQDVPPGSVVRLGEDDTGWLMVCGVSEKSVHFNGGYEKWTWDQMMPVMQILRPGSTTWEPCWKLQANPA